MGMGRGQGEQGLALPLLLTGLLHWPAPKCIMIKCSNEGLTRSPNQLSPLVLRLLIGDLTS